MTAFGAAVAAVALIVLVVLVVISYWVGRERGRDDIREEQDRK
jgi:hypothetical protein